MRIVWIFSAIGLAMLFSSLIFLKKEPNPVELSVPEQSSEMEQLLISEVFEQDDTEKPVFEETQPTKKIIVAKGSEVVILENQSADTSFDSDVAVETGLGLNEIALGVTGTSVETAPESDVETITAVPGQEDDAGDSFSSGALGAFPELVAKPEQSSPDPKPESKPGPKPGPNPESQELKSAGVSEISRPSETVEEPVKAPVRKVQKKPVGPGPEKSEPKTKKAEIGKKLEVSKKADVLKSAKVEKQLSSPVDAVSKVPAGQKSKTELSDVVAMAPTPATVSTAPVQPVAKPEVQKNIIAVIVHKDNSEDLSREDIRNIYTDRMAWRNGRKVTIFDLPLQSKHRELFSTAVLKMSARQAATAASNRKVTNQYKNIHKTKKNRLVASFVARNKNAIGYVSLDSVKNNKNVRIVYTIE